MALAKWAIDTSWASATFTAGDVNSLASGGGALSTSVLSNSTGLDMLVDLSFVVTVGGTTVSGSRIDFYLLPLNQDGSTYGDGYASSTTVLPTVGFVGGVPVKVGVTSGNTVVGSLDGVLIRPRDYKIVIANQLTVALSATPALTLKTQTYNESIS